MKKLLSVTALALVSFSANAAIVSVNIDSGDWASSTSSNNNADASVNSTRLYDNGAAIPLVELGAPNPAFQWKDDAAVAPYPVKAGLTPFDGTYGGSITYDDSTGDVIGGSLVITGKVGDQVVVGGNSWWLRIWEDVTVDLATGLGTVGSIDCARTDFSAANCSPGVTGGMPFAWNISDGAFTPGACALPGGSNAGDPACGPDAPARLKATFDGTTLSLLVEGRNLANPNGTDTLNDFTLSTTVVPVPAAVWLFGSAIGLLGFRRKMKA